MTTDVPPTHWHAVRPWRPTLSLVVREITSVSATFLLSALVHAPGPADAAVEQSLAAIGLSNLNLSPDDPDSNPDSDADTGGSGGGGGGAQIVSDVLAKGLSVKVNGTPWQRVLMRVDDDADEAVVILFGLMPGRQYDVELGVVPSEKTLRSQITTGAGADPSLDPGPSDHAHALTLAQPPPHPALSPLTADADGALAADAPSSAPPFSLEDRRLQLAHQLALLTAEHASLAHTLKAARRDAQKADAALRAEIDALRRASERAAPAELRARQRALALQEAARQALAAAEGVQGRVGELEAALPALTARRDAVEREWEGVRREAEAARARREEAEAREKKRAEARHAEEAGVGAKLEKLAAKRERLEGEGGVLGELEERLRRLEEERARVEGDPYGYGFEEFAPEDEDEVVSPTRERERDESQPSPSSAHRTHGHLHAHHHAHPRKRHTHPSNAHAKAPAPIGPIQRPALAQTRNAGPANAVATLPPGPGVIHLHHAHTGSLPSNTRRPPPPAAPSVAGSTSGSSSSSPSPAHVGASLLSSRAPPFEPRVGAAGATASTGPVGRGEFKKTPGAGRQ